MSNIFKVRNYIQAMATAVDNYEHGRKDLEYLERVLKGRVEYIVDAIEAEKRSTEPREE